MKEGVLGLDEPVRRFRAFSVSLNLLQSVAALLMMLFGAACSANAAESIATYGVTADSRLHISSEMYRPVIGDPDATFLSPVGIYSATFETATGVFFAAPQGLRFGDAKKNALKPGGIFVPKDYTAKSPAYFYIGTPPSVKKVADFWQDLYVDEGATWHIENPRTGPQPPPDALTVVGAWVAGYSPGSWQIKRAAAPVYRFAPPSGWLVALTLCPAGKSPTDRDAYPEKKFSVVLDHGRVAWVLQTAEIKKNGKYIIALPPDQLEWVQTDVGSH